MNAEAPSPAADTDTEQDKIAARWRRAILNLSETLLSACDERQDLSPFLMEAMHSALENLLIYGEADDLLALEEWLNEEKPGTHRHKQAEREASEPDAKSRAMQPLEESPAIALPAYLPAAERLPRTSSELSNEAENQPQNSISSTRQAAPDKPATERRVNGERRIHNERRGVPRLHGEYRSGRDRRRLALPEFSDKAQAAPQQTTPPAGSVGERDLQPSGAESSTAAP